jgi:hypothetical protein
MTFTSLGRSIKVQTWFLSKFSNSLYMALTQLESERACPTSRGSKIATKSVFKKQERWADLEEWVTISFMLPMICWGGCTFWMWEGAPGLEMIYPSICDASAATVEEVVAWGASASSVKVWTCSGDDVDGSSGSSLSLSMPYSPSSTKMLSAISLSPAHSTTPRGQGAVSSKVASHDSTMVLFSKL